MLPTPQLYRHCEKKMAYVGHVVNGSSVSNAELQLKDNMIFLDKSVSLIIAKVDTLESRREQLTERFFDRVFYGNRPAYTICYRANGTQSLQTDCAMQKHLNHC